MAKKKKSASRKPTKRGSKKKTGGGGFDTQNLLGLGIAAFANKQIDGLTFVQSQDPKMVAAGKIILGSWGMNQSFVTGTITDPSMRTGIGNGIAYEGIKSLMAEFGIAGMANDSLSDNDDLAVVIEGDDDDDDGSFNEDVLGDDDDIDTINEDVLGDDDDLDTINDDDFLD